MARRNRGGSGKVDVITVDFTGVAGSNRVPEGDYLVRVDTIEHKIGEDSGKPYLLWMLEIVDGKYAGRKLRHQTSLQKHALFNLRNTLEALGVPVPESSLRLNLREYIGMEMGVTVELEAYNGRNQSRVVDLFPADELLGDGEDPEDNEDDPEAGDNDPEDEEVSGGEPEDEELPDAIVEIDGESIEITEEALEDMDLSTLRKVAKALGLKVGRRDDQDDLIDKILDHVEGSSGEEGEDL